MIAPTPYSLLDKLVFDAFRILGKELEKKKKKESVIKERRRMLFEGKDVGG